MMYIQLFLSFLNIGLFSFGGGYAAMPLIQAQVVDVHHWLTMTEFTDLITISQMTPGPIAINSATFVGTRIAGIPGAVAATIGCILPSQHVTSPKYSEDTAPCCRCHGGCRRNINPDHCLLGFRWFDPSI